MRYKVKQSTENGLFLALERKLDEWIVDKRSKGACLTGSVIKQQALIIFNDIYKNSEEASLEF
jgi:hypothetical protein